ncbi:MAG TPA: hypothetical protein VNQ97_16330 [Burkholderiaceae bacterium]|nr:hypothetical protein [Burkholderiaceae bacterium]
MRALALLSVAAAFGCVYPSTAMASSLRVYTCDTTIAPRPALQVEDEASLAGALVESPSLVVLPNGMKAVQFAVRYAKRLIPSDRILKVRYTVTWFDDCGRTLMNGANTLEGLALSPRQYQTLQSTAMHPDASRALLRIYVD